MLSEKIKAQRRQAGLSQEQLAEKLGVSRQAVTKWETAAGVPDIDNLKGLSALFGMTIDELLDQRAPGPSRQDFFYDSVTDYDIDGVKNYDINLIGSKQVMLSGYEGEKLSVRLASNQMADIKSAVKVKIDDMKKNIDVDLHRQGDMTETRAKEELFIFIRFPQQYVKQIEVNGNTGILKIRNLESENIEYSGRTSCTMLEDVTGHVELNFSKDSEILCSSLNGRLDVNQISCTARLSLPAETAFMTRVRGIGNCICYEKDGRPSENFSVQPADGSACENVIELNGMKSELTINAVTAR